MWCECVRDSYGGGGGGVGVPGMDMSAPRKWQIIMLDFRLLAQDLH